MLHNRILLSRDKNVDLTAVSSCFATLFECLRQNHFSLRKVLVMWRLKPDPLLFWNHSWDWQSITGAGGYRLDYKISLFRIKCSLWQAVVRVATDLENQEKSGNLKETSESQGICLKCQGICCLKLIFSLVEDSNFENFLGSMPPDPPKWSRTHGRA